MDKLVPAHYITSKTIFTGVEDTENHLMAFNAQMIVSRGSDVVRCKMFMITFTGTTLQWFSGLPDGHVTSFVQFVRLFREQFTANQVTPSVLYDLFTVRKREGETLKEYLNRFWALMLRLQTHDEDVMVTAFEQGITMGPFSDSLNRNQAETFFEIQRRVVAHINIEEAVAIPETIEKLRFPQKPDKILGSRNDVWCEFHKGFGHSIERCLALGHQLTELLREGFLKEYLETSLEEPQGEVISAKQTHEVPVNGKLNTISQGFSGGGSTATKHKRYARVVMSLDVRSVDALPKAN